MGRRLYHNFEILAKQYGCNKLKAITSVGNITSIRFHMKIGIHLLGDKNKEGTEVVKDYSGPWQDRVVFEKII